MKKLLSVKFSNGIVHFSLLLLRIGLGVMMLTHGWPKLVNFAGRVNDFPDPFHVGRNVSLGMTIFAEVFCSSFLILGLFSRLATIPLLITMSVVIFVVQAHAPFARQELAVHFLLGYLVLFLCGPGKLSLDGLINR